MADKIRILFLCTGNSCRSQMAEGWSRHLKGSQIEAYSAGTKPNRLNLNAVKVMREAGVDISCQRSKHVNELLHLPFHFVITLCSDAKETCPIFPGKAKHLHVGFDDPPILAESAKTEEEALNHYRRIRDEIKSFILTLPNVFNT